MRHVLRALLVLVTAAGIASAAARQEAPAPPPATQVPPPAAPAPETVVPGAPAAPVVAAVPGTAPACPLPVPPATAPTRVFTGKTGMLLHQVQPTRVADFEKLIAYLRDALAKTTDPTVQEQARGWNIFRVSEPGPNADVLYVFLFDPAVPCVDYGINRILADAYPDPAQLQEIWKLYTGSIRTGGHLMNLVPVPVVPPAPFLTPPTIAPAPAASPAAPATEKPGGP